MGGDPRVPVVLEYGLGRMKGPRPYMSYAKNRGFQLVPEVMRKVYGGVK